MRTRLLLVTLGLVLCLPALSVAKPPFKALDYDTTMGDLGKLRNEISLLNLVNGLYLSEQQRAELLAIAKQAQALKQGVMERHAVLIQEMNDAFQVLHAELIQGNGISKPVEKRAHEANEKGKDATDNVQKELKMLEGRVAGVLNDSQKQIVEDFTPCLIPPKNLKDPSRVGQANDASKGEAMLDRLRNLPPKRDAQVVQARILDEYMDRLGKNVHLTGAEQIAERARAKVIMNRAVSMTPQEYAINRSELGEQLMATAENKKKERDRAQEVFRDPNAPGKIGRFLLDPAIIPVLEAQGRVLSSHTQPAAAQLTSAPAAENCDNGICAINKQKPTGAPASSDSGGPKQALTRLAN